MGSRQEAAVETRRKLLESAKRLVCEKGLANTSVEEITGSCGVSCGTFYTYFKRKEDIVYAISKDMFESILEGAQSADGPLMDRLTFFMTRFSGYIEAGGLKLCQEWVRNTVDPDLVDDPYSRGKLSMDIGSLRQVLEEGVRRGELSSDAPVEGLALMLADVLYGQMLCWCMSGGAYGFEERTEGFCRSHLGQIMAPFIEG